MNTEYGEYIKSLFSTADVEKYQTRHTRRSLAIAVVAIFALSMLFMSLPSSVGWLGVIILLSTIPLIARLNMSVRGITEIPLELLDERQTNLRLKANHDVYVFAITLALVAGFVIDSLVMLFIVYALLLGLPTLVLAWRLPDETDSESDA